MPLRCSGKGVIHIDSRTILLFMDPFSSAEVIDADVGKSLAKEVFPPNYEELVGRNAG
jgi:hypothetical protein